MEIYQAKFDLDDFIENDELNTQIYGALLSLQDGAQNRYKMKRDVVYMFNRVYEICHIIRQQKHPEQYFYEYWNKLRAEHTSYETSIIFSAVYVVLSLRPQTENNLMLFLTRVKAKIDPNYYEVFEPVLSNGKAYADNRTLPADFSFLKSEADKIQDLGERELFYQEYLTRYKQAQNQGDILKQIEDEIKLLEKQKNFQPRMKLKSLLKSTKGFRAKSKQL